jgi:uncharacterized membrane protein YtjA (UPF0391 family)
MAQGEELTGPVRQFGSPDEDIVLIACLEPARLVSVKFAKGAVMSLLKWALIMLLVSLVAALLGFTGLSAASAEVARALFYIFAVIFLVLLVFGLLGARAARGP